MGGGRRAALAMLAATTLASGARLSAHRLDELLQAARIAVERDRVLVEMALTPGKAVADGVIRAIDTDRNGVLSEDERQRYATAVLGALTMRVDDSLPLHMELAVSRFPTVAALRAGDGAIVIRSQSAVRDLAAGPHRIFFRNRHAPAHSVYVANALVPESDQIAVTRQQRDRSQRELIIDFVIRTAPAESHKRTEGRRNGGFEISPPVIG